MRKVIFALAGRQHPLEPVFLESRHRQYKRQTTVFHRNDYQTELRMPVPYFKEHFKYEASQGIYRTKLTWQDVVAAGFVEIWLLEPLEGWRLISPPTKE